MTPERWRHIEQLYHRALECPADERAIWLAEACADDEALRREIEALLTANEMAGDFLSGHSLDWELKK